MNLLTRNALFTVGIAGAIASQAVALPAFAETPRTQTLDYLYLEKSPSGHITYYEGSERIDRDRFLDAITRLNADPEFSDRVNGERFFRSSLLAGAGGLLLLLPVTVGMFAYDYRINPGGTYTRTWMGASVVDVLASAGTALYYLYRKKQPLFSFDEASQAAVGYNEQLDTIDQSPRR